MGRILSAVTCYNNEFEVIEFGRQLSNQSCAERIVFIVTINSCIDYQKFKAEINKLNLKCHIFQAPENLGYLNGCLYGLRRLDHINSDDKVIISNTDLTILDTNAYQKIADEMENSNIWCLGPSIHLKTGEFQNPFLISRPRKTTVLKWKIFQGTPVLLKIYDTLARIKKKHNITHEKMSSMDVYAVHGCFFALNEVCTRNIMQVCDKIFMYGEELLVAEIVILNKGRTRYLDDVEIIHNENSTTHL